MAPFSRLQRAISMFSSLLSQ